MDLRTGACPDVTASYFLSVDSRLRTTGVGSNEVADKFMIVNAIFALEKCY